MWQKTGLWTKIWPDSLGRMDLAITREGEFGLGVESAKVSPPHLPRTPSLPWVLLGAILSGAPAAEALEAPGRWDRVCFYLVVTVGWVQG